ncbi:DUF1648 domain-containing protein [Roseivirga echinicomitans]|uniref:DUF1648 domain-containing protein n=1 Tax=Roseivirga echinicomitans TaxID=296218 RepID=A0A150X1T7_9BACT|nr:DUF1648 domain-containing protein [Roseivirga echinicomitans]KYG72695.1 hypothetical protein AWN68_08285 [Roseivirga echinicomitans]
MNKNGRPKLALKLSGVDIGMELLGWLSLIGIWVLVFLNFQNLPDTIPIHFNAAGKADGFGSKWSILTLPIIASVLYVGMTILNKFPHVFNYPTEAVTEENALKNYTMATRLIRVLKLMLVIIFGLIVFMTLQNINGTAEGLGVWFLPLTLGMIFIPITYYIIKLVKAKHT